MSDSQMFAGKKLWFSHQIPQRKWLIENAEAYGAVIVPLEKQADVILVDHTKKGHGPGTHSYRFVELSIRNGQLEDLDNHTVGCVIRAERPVGSVRTGAKGTRTPFNEADDQLLWNWVKPYENLNGACKGNEIYKQLERLNQRHTFQSWRDRWIKYTQFQKREITSEVGPAYEVQSEGIYETPRKPQNLAKSERDADNLESRAQAGAHESSASGQANISVTQTAKASAMGGSHSKVLVNTTAPTEPHSGKEQFNQGINAQSALAHEKLQEKSLQAKPTERAVVPQNLSQQRFHGHPKNEAQDELQYDTTEEEDNDNDDSDAEDAGTDAVVASKEQTKRVTPSPKQVVMLPLAYHFTPDVAQRLYRAVPHILNGDDSSHLDRMWTRLMQEYPGYGDQSTWVSYFEKFIYPAWLNLEGLDPGDKDQIDNHVRLVIRIQEAKLALKYSTKALKQGTEASHSQREIAESQNASAGEESREITQGPSQRTANECANCFTVKTYRWRKDLKGRDLCDACGRFLKKNGVMRPSSTWTEPPDIDDVDEEQTGSDEDDKNDTTQEVQTKAFSPAKKRPAPQEPASSIVERPPGPNESRKRSQGRSTQSDSQSQPNSQSTTTGGTDSYIPYREEPSEAMFPSKSASTSILDSGVPRVELPQVIQSNVQSPKRYKSESEDSIISPKRRKVWPSGERSQPPRPRSRTSLSSQVGGESEEENEQENTLDGSPELGMTGSIARTYGRDDSPLFVPQDSDVDLSDFLSTRSSKESIDGDGVDDLLIENNNQSGSLPVNLFDEEDVDPDTEEYSSDYAPSEAPSEGVQFDDTPSQLSQAWDTAPQSKDVGNGVGVEQRKDLDDSNYYATRFEQPISSASPGSIRAHNKIAKKQTVSPKANRSMLLPVEDSNTAGHGHGPLLGDARQTPPTDPNTARSVNRGDSLQRETLTSSRLETQALFQQSLPAAAEYDFLLIPSPEGGWETDSELDIVGENVIDPSTSMLVSIKEEEDLIPDEATSSRSVSADEDDPDQIDQFIIKQKRLYSGSKLDDTILEAIAIRALESTSLETGLASYAVEAMVRRYINSKENVFGLDSSVSSETIPTRKSAKKLRKKLLDQLVDDLLPDDMQGVWTNQDDELLYGSDARNIRRMGEKHGTEAMGTRLEYLEELHRP